MVQISFSRNRLDQIVGFSISGHAGYADKGQDIVCAAVSVLVINTINSIKSFTDDEFTYNEDEEDGIIEFSFNSAPGSKALLLVKSMELGLHGVEEEYGNRFIRIKN